MKIFPCVVTLLAGFPTLLPAQVKVGATLGPISVIATLVGGQRVSIRATPVSSHHATTPVSRDTKAMASRVLATARRYLGTRYRYGGAAPATGFDCSGFVQYVFGRNHVELPRTSRQQATVGRRVAASVDSLVPGDLMLFSSNGNGINHVAIYVGNNQMVHSAAGKGKVVYENLSTARGKWYLARHVASRRVL